MTWLVFGVSCLLVLAGAVSIISGAPIIQLERGWAEVISGTVALASGGVVFALAGILMRLESIRDTLAARTLPVAADAAAAAAQPAVPAAPTAAPTPKPPSKTIEALPPVPPASPEPLPPPPLRPMTAEPPASAPVEPAAAEAKDQALWKRVKRPEAERPDTDGLRQHGFPDRIVPDGPAEPSLNGEPPVVVPAHAVPAAPMPEPTRPEPATPPRDAGEAGWLERSLFKGRSARSDTDPAAPRPGALPRPGERLEPAMPAFAPATGETLAVAAPEPTAAAEPQPTPDLASEQHGGATVVGRYQAGSASYVMYSDGTIEVETESGETHRFGSMDELKAFIAQQESTVS